MKNSQRQREPRNENGEAGFGLVDSLMATVVIAVVLLQLATMFLTSYSLVSSEGRQTMGLAAARQMMEDIRALPFANIPNLNGFDTQSSATLPAGDPERTIARHWRYSLAGDGDGFTTTSTEQARWQVMTVDDAATLNGRGQIAVTNVSGTLVSVTVTVTVPNAPTPITLTTLVSRL